MAETPPELSRRSSYQAEVVSDHLPTGFSARFDGVSSSRQSSPHRPMKGTSPEEESSLKLQGGDVHRDIFKIENRARLHRRAQTFAYPVRREPEDDMTASEQLEPQGFRRQFVRSHRSFVTPSTAPVTRNFVEFLDLYGAFAGEDLAESDDEALIDEEEDQRATESRPLLGRRKSSRVKQRGDAGTTKTFFTLLKAFIGTGIMFLPKAFNNGGLVFSLVALVTVSAVTMVAFHLLLSCRKVYGGGYGEIGKAISGPKMRGIILMSITLSQLGFVCAGMVFVAQNLSSFLRAVTHGNDPLPSRALIAIQAIILIPLAFIRNISKLGPAALLADVFILIGLVYIWYYDISWLASNGLNSTVVMFNPASYTQTLGSAIFTFEGIGLILPIQSSMKDPAVFEWLLLLVMFIITVIFTSVGALCYATFGTGTNIEIIDNFPQTSKLVNAVQFLYAMAVLIGTPVQLFPPLRIIEGKIFGHLSGKKDTTTKWKKNGFRTAMVILCIGVSIGGSTNLDKFVSLIGSVACVPLVYIYPAFLHYKGVAGPWYEKAGDVLLMTLGVVGMLFTTAVTLMNSFLNN